ncbi:MAG: hypothetical protein LQ351_005236 [Letrouitia transgressa]|nr:MAG: hypothetical protein LQ351_005236 [Letrouitia transgressa]
MSATWDEATERRVILATLRLYADAFIISDQSLDHLVAVASTPNQRFTRSDVREHLNSMVGAFDPGVPLPGSVIAFRGSRREDEEGKENPEGAAAAAVHQNTPNGVHYPPTLNGVHQPPTPNGVHQPPTPNGVHHPPTPNEIHPPPTQNQIHPPITQNGINPPPGPNDQVGEMPPGREEPLNLNGTEEDHDGGSEGPADMEISSGEEA